MMMRIILFYNWNNQNQQMVNGHRESLSLNYFSSSSSSSIQMPKNFICYTTFFDTCFTYDGFFFHSIHV